MQGLQNIGGTCYLNAATQLLYAIPDFRNFTTPTNELEAAFCQIFRQMKAGERTSVAPILAAKKLDLGAESSGYVLSFILDWLSKELTKNINFEMAGGKDLNILVIIHDKHVKDSLLETLELYEIQKHPKYFIIDTSTITVLGARMSYSFSAEGNIYKILSFIVYQLGHYFAICRHSDIWYLFNDSFVQKIPKDRVISYLEQKVPGAAPFVLCYEMQE
jgi:hypothetical protein